jgi:molybdenum cofactor biosynthesis enzyme MoaA
MDVGGATHWSPERVVSSDQMLAVLTSHYGPIDPILEETSAPAQRFSLPDGTTFGIIASTTAPFCRTCDRSRVTADGVWYMCLYARHGLDLRGPLRRGATPAELTALIEGGWRGRTDRGAEQRLSSPIADRSSGEYGRIRTSRCTPAAVSARRLGLPAGPRTIYASSRRSTWPNNGSETA